MTNRRTILTLALALIASPALAQSPNLWPCKTRRAFVSTLADRIDLDHPVEPCIRPGVENGAVDHAENRNGRADAERQRQDRGQREARSLNHLSESKANVLQQSLHESLA